jgi:hypothetical protein
VSTGHALASAAPPKSDRDPIHHPCRQKAALLPFQYRRGTRFLQNITAVYTGHRRIRPSIDRHSPFLM